MMYFICIGTEIQTGRSFQNKSHTQTPDSETEVLLLKEPPVAYASAVLKC